MCQYKAHLAGFDGGGGPRGTLCLFPKISNILRDHKFYHKTASQSNSGRVKEILTGLSDLCLWSGLMDESCIKTPLSHT